MESGESYESGPARGSVSPHTRVAQLALFSLPLGHLVVVPVGGAVATAADLAIGFLALSWVVLLALEPTGILASLSALTRGSAGGPRRSYVAGIVLLVVYGVWVAASGLWGFHGQYALAKGAAVAGMSVAALAVATSGGTWGRAVDAWLAGAAAALVASVAISLVTDGALASRLVYEAGGVSGLPFPRPTGPFVHPNMLGDYVLVTFVLLWARFPHYSLRTRRLAGALAVGLGAALVGSLSTAWVGLGVVAIVAGRWGHVGRWGRFLRVGGSLVAGVTVVALLVPVDFQVGGAEIATSGLRPAIWRASLRAIAEAPIFGVGASPYLAQVADPVTGGAAMLWDAHNIVLSVLGQFGLIGAGLFAVGLYVCLRSALAGADDRLTTSLRLAWIGAGVNSMFLASEDLRHLWLLLGLTGLAYAERSAREARDARVSSEPGSGLEGAV